jgi:hypothetical protein
MTHIQRVGDGWLLTEYLDAIGRRLDEIHVPGSSGLPIEGAHAYLYDLSDPSRLTSTDADSYALQPNPVNEDERRWLCYGVTISEPGRSAL